MSVGSSGLDCTVCISVVAITGKDSNAWLLYEWGGLRFEVKMFDSFAVYLQSSTSRFKQLHQMHYNFNIKEGIIQEKNNAKVLQENVSHTKEFGKDVWVNKILSISMKTCNKKLRKLMNSLPYTL